jgi:hypothetical protein
MGLVKSTYRRVLWQGLSFGERAVYGWSTAALIIFYTQQKMSLLARLSKRRG